ncbi:MAG: N-acetylgalactosamine-6-sulfatase [Planctomycetota bacterium]|nr:MAG: N-acetylgalactosamine-6-sulfatase [Planctomycetota bacterium]
MHNASKAVARLVLAALVLYVGAFACRMAAAAPADKPNIIWIMADDLGYGDLGCYGQKRIRTPNIDRLASQGLRCTSCYAGSTVCAPSRCTLMTGLHTGHCRVRSNARVPLEPGDVTVAEVLKSAGYATGIVGKWGLGEPDTTGIPTRQGFDYWFGYLNQRHAHNYYPDYLWRNEQRVPLENVVSGGVASKRVSYSADLFAEEALAFVEREQGGPFFLYLALTQPHANNEAGKKGMEVPSDDPYSDESWPQAQKNHAAMITYLDTQVGSLLDRLEELGLADNTVVFFTSDNGPHREGGADPEFFNSSGPLRGIKRDLYEGGIRVPMIVRYPGKIAAGTTSDEPWAFWDALPTLAELAGAQAPADIDGISMVPTLLGKNASRPQPEHEYLYWEFPERGFSQAVRQGKWKAVRNKPAASLELFDLSADLGETNDIAEEHPDVVARMERLLAAARTPSDYLPIDRKAASKAK